MRIGLCVVGHKEMSLYEQMSKEITEIFFPGDKCSKRPRSSSLPEMEKSNVRKDPKGDDGNYQGTNEIIMLIKELLDKKLEIIATRDDIKILAVQVIKLAEENKSLREEVSSIKTENKNLFKLQLNWKIQIGKILGYSRV